MHTAPNLTYTLPADAHYHIVRNAIRILPPPPDPSPDAEARRDNAFIARVADLQPQGSAEVELATTFVTCMELARDAVLLSRTPEIPFAMVLKCRAQAASMFRQANSASRELRYLKQARAKAASLPELTGPAERAEHLATVLMAEGLTNPPPPVKLIEPGPEDSTPLIASSYETESSPPPRGRPKRTPRHHPSHPTIPRPITRKLRHQRDTRSPSPRGRRSRPSRPKRTARNQPSHPTIPGLENTKLRQPRDATIRSNSPRTARILALSEHGVSPTCSSPDPANRPD